MFRKTFIIFLIGVSLQNTEATGGLLSGFLTAPFNLASGALSIAGDVVDNALDVASTLINAAISNVNAMANHILRSSQRLSQGLLGEMDVTLSILKNASLDIGSTLSRFCRSLLTAQSQLLNNLIGVEKDIVHDSIEDGKRFILGLIQSGQIILSTTTQNYEDAIKDISSLAEDLIHKAKKNGDENKAASLEAIAENIKNLQNEFTKLREHFSDEVKKAIDELTKLPDNISIEETEKKLKDVLKALKNTWSNGRKNIEDMKQQFQKIVEASGDVAEDIKSRFNDCQKQFEEINKDLEDFTEKVSKSASQMICDVVDKSKKGMGSLFNSSFDALSDSVSGIENMVGSTMNLIGDFMKDRIKCISDAKKIVLDTLNDVRKATGNTLDKLTDIAEDFTSHAETTSSGILDMALDRLVQVIQTVDDSVKGGGNALGNVVNQTMDLVNKAKTEISAAINDDIKHIQSTYNSAAEVIKGISTGVADALRNVTENMRDLLSQTISTAQASIATKVNLFQSIVDHGISGARRLARSISISLRKFQNNLQTALTIFRDEAQLKISEGIQTIQNLSSKFLGHLQETYIKGSKKYFECSKEARKNLDNKMPSFIEKIQSCGKKGIKDVVQNIDIALDLEEGMSPKVEQLLSNYENCRNGRILGFSCLFKIPVDKILGLTEAFADVIKGTGEAAKNMKLCNAEYIDESKNYFTQLREEFDNCIKQN